MKETIYGYFTWQPDGRIRRHGTHKTELPGAQFQCDEFTVNITEDVTRSTNNFGAERTDFWFVHEGKRYHGVQVGDTNLASVREVKAKKPAPLW